MKKLRDNRRRYFTTDMMWGEGQITPHIQDMFPFRLAERDVEQRSSLPCWTWCQKNLGEQALLRCGEARYGVQAWRLHPRRKWLRFQMYYESPDPRLSMGVPPWVYRFKDLSDATMFKLIFGEYL